MNWRAYRESRGNAVGEVVIVCDEKDADAPHVRKRLTHYQDKGMVVDLRPCQVDTNGRPIKARAEDR